MKLHLITHSGEEKKITFKDGITKAEFFSKLRDNNVDLKEVRGFGHTETWSSFTDLYPVADYFEIKY